MSTLITNRRNFILGGIATIIAAPAIIRVADLMPIKAIEATADWVATPEDFFIYDRIKHAVGAPDIIEKAVGFHAVNYPGGRHHTLIAERLQKQISMALEEAIRKERDRKFLVDSVRGPA